jgi:phage tail-like protein
MAEQLIAADVFILSVPDIDTIGQFSHCSGLEMWFEMYEYAEGGNNDFVHKLPGRLIFPNLVLSRGLTNSDALLRWFAQTKTKAQTQQPASVRFPGRLPGPLDRSDVRHQRPRDRLRVT